MASGGSGGLLGFARSRGLDWREGTPASQLTALGVLMVVVAAATVVSLVDYNYMPVATYYLWLMIGMILLRLRLLVVLVGWTTAGAFVAMESSGRAVAPVTAFAVLVLAGALVLYQAARERSGLPAALGASLLADLRDLLKRQGQVPPLPPGWDAESAMIAAHGVSYAGDFMVAEVSDDKRRLLMVLVDVCGKGVSAGPRSLQLAGALGGLVGSVPEHQLLTAVNRFLLRQESLESFATAVSVDVDLGTGRYTVRNAGHPPALRWSHRDGSWSLDGARGVALGVVDDPDLETSEGTLAPGDALMFYTDGVVESRGGDLDEGIAWLQGTAQAAVAGGFPGAPKRVLRRVPRGDDDRAVLVLSRRADGA